MSGARSGVKAVVQEASTFQLCLLDTESYLGKIARFFSYSAKRQRLLVYSRSLFQMSSSGLQYIVQLISSTRFCMFAVYNYTAL